MHKHRSCTWKIFPKNGFLKLGCIQESQGPLREIPGPTLRDAHLNAPPCYLDKGPFKSPSVCSRSWKLPTQDNATGTTLHKTLVNIHNNVTPPPKIPHSRTLIVPHTVCGATGHANRKKLAGSYCIREPWDCPWAATFDSLLRKISNYFTSTHGPDSSILQRNMPACAEPLAPAFTEPLVTLNAWREKDAFRIQRQEIKSLRKNLPKVLLLPIIWGEQITSDLNIISFLWKKKSELSWKSKKMKPDVNLF